MTGREKDLGINVFFSCFIIYYYSVASLPLSGFLYLVHSAYPIP